MSCVVKGFSLNANTSKLINFDSIKDLVLNYRKRKIEAKQLIFTRDKKNWSVQCQENKKIYGFVYNKRRILDDLTTLPFGFQ